MMSARWSGCVLSYVLMMPDPVLACVLCWSGPSCKWLSVGACRVGHHGVEPVEQRQAGDTGEGGVAAHVRELHGALAKLAATVMWRNGVPSVVECGCSLARTILEVQFVEKNVEIPEI